MIIDFKICALGSGLEVTFWSFEVRACNQGQNINFFTSSAKIIFFTNTRKFKKCVKRARTGSKMATKGLKTVKTRIFRVIITIRVRNSNLFLSYISITIIFTFSEYTIKNNSQEPYLNNTLRIRDRGYFRVIMTIRVRNSNFFFHISV